VDALAAQLMLTIVTDEYDVDPFTPKKSVNAPELQSPLLDSNKGMTSRRALAAVQLIAAHSTLLC